MKEREVLLSDMLEAREARCWMQQALLKKYDRTLLCFTMNIAGPVKNNDGILRGFRMGQGRLKEQLELSGIRILEQRENIAFTGNEAFYVLDAEPQVVKRLTCEIEDRDALGRLLDLDVHGADGQQVSRNQLLASGRKCLICGGPAKICSSRRVHRVEELQERTREILQKAFREEDGDQIASLAVRSLLYEVCVTPKPGLVDRDNSGSHKDMDIFTFMSSAASLFPYFRKCAELGMDTREQEPPETFRLLRQEGKYAEAAMKRATAGVNTHKGAIFSMGILCGALGRLEKEQWKKPEVVLAECAGMIKGIAERDFCGLNEDNAVTAGQKLYVKYGITGVRGQAEDGFPAVLKAGLPTLEKGITVGLSLNDAGCNALLALLTAATDTNLIARSSRQTQLEVTARIQSMLEEKGLLTKEEIQELDREFMEKNLSPGGSADLLAMTYMLYFLINE